MPETLAKSLQQLAQHLEDLEFRFSPTEVPLQRDRLLRRLREHLIARGEDLDAPLVAVLVGSTGVGKSTILNSLVGSVTETSAQRPTTLTPVLVHHPDDELWLAGDRILGGFEKLRIEEGDDSPVGRHPDKPLMKMTTSTKLQPGIVLIDTPDTDSYQEANQHITSHLAEVGDLWIFVTTAQRYAEPQGLALLRAAAKRHAALGVVLNRVGRGGLIDSKQGLAEKLAEVGLGDTPIFTILEGDLEQGAIPESKVESLRNWLDAIASDALMRSALARQTFFGSLREVFDLSLQVVSDFESESAAFTAVQNQLAEFSETQQQRAKAEWYRSKIFAGDPINRFAEYSWSIIEENLAENAWERKRLAWSRGLLGTRPAPESTREVLSRVLDIAFAQFETRLHEALSHCVQELKVASLVSVQDTGTTGEGSTDFHTPVPAPKPEIYQNWLQRFASVLEQAQSQALRPWDERKACVIFQAVLIRCFHPWETASQEFLLHFFRAPDVAPLVEGLRSIMDETLDSRISTVVTDVTKRLPNTSGNIETGKEIKNYIAELQEQWFS